MSGQPRCWHLPLPVLSPAWDKKPGSKRCGVFGTRPSWWPRLVRHLTLSLSRATLPPGASGSSSTKWGLSLDPPSHPPLGRLSGADAGQKRCYGYGRWSQTGWAQIRALVLSNQVTGGRTLELGLPHLCAFNSLFPGVGLLPVGDQEGAVSRTVWGCIHALLGGCPLEWEAWAAPPTLPGPPGPTGTWSAGACVSL